MLLLSIECLAACRDFLKVFVKLLGTGGLFFFQTGSTGREFCPGRFDFFTKASQGRPLFPHRLGFRGELFPLPAGRLPVVVDRSLSDLDDFLARFQIAECSVEFFFSGGDRLLVFCQTAELLVKLVVLRRPVGFKLLKRHLSIAKVLQLSIKLAALVDERFPLGRKPVLCLFEFGPFLLQRELFESSRFFSGFDSGQLGFKLPLLFFEQGGFFFEVRFLLAKFCLSLPQLCAVEFEPLAVVLERRVVFVEGRLRSSVCVRFFIQFRAFRSDV